MNVGGRSRGVARANALTAHYVCHVAVHILDAQTITHGLNDSPVGMLA